MTDESPAVISVENVSKWYGSVVAVNDVSFEIEPASRAFSDRTAPARPRCSR